MSVVKEGAESQCKPQPLQRQWLLYVPPGNIKKMLLSAHKFHLFVLFGSQRRSFPCITLSDFFKPRRGGFTVRYEMNFYIEIREIFVFICLSPNFFPYIIGTHKGIFQPITRWQLILGDC